MLKRSFGLSVLGLLLAVSAQAQLISIRTVPVAQSDQFDIYPSHNLAMGGVFIALADPLLDPFTNPAKAARETGGRFYGSPLLYNVSNGAGAGRTLPLALVARRGPWFGTASFALQQVDPSETSQIFSGLLNTTTIVGPEPAFDPPGQSHGNAYAYAAFGKTLPSGVSVAGSVRWAGLNAIDGVDLLYAGSAGIDQHGYAGDVRLGLLKEWAGDKSLEVLFLHNRFRMQHGVTFLDSFWNPVTQSTGRRARLQQNFDYSDAWGVHFAHQRPLNDLGWRIGGILTSNIMSHPKLPEYDVRDVGIVPIWGDPGYSFAFNVGLGVSKTRESSTFAMDAVFEPIWTNTWGEATAAMPTQDGLTVPVGGATVENWFTFSNAQFHMGIDQKLFPRKNAVSVQLGLALHSISYRMTQHDNIQALWRNQAEQWLEWTPTWGLTLRFTDMEVRYRGRVSNGTGRPGVIPRNSCRNCALDFAVASGNSGSNILVAPSGPLTLTPVAVSNHQVSVSVPIH